MDRLKIIGDDIELDGRLVARIVVPEGTLRERAMEALERACRPEPEISFDTQAEYDAEIDKAYNNGYAAAKAKAEPA